MSKTGEWVIDRMNEEHERNMGRDRDDDEMMGDMMCADHFTCYPPPAHHYPTEMAILETKWECDACGAEDDGRIFITVKRGDGRERHFCSYDCYKRYDPDTDIIKGED